MKSLKMQEEKLYCTLKDNICNTNKSIFDDTKGKMSLGIPRGGE